MYYLYYMIYISLSVTSFYAFLCSFVLDMLFCNWYRYFILFFCWAHGMWKLLSEGWNLNHSRDHSGSLTHGAIRELRDVFVFNTFR